MSDADIGEILKLPTEERLRIVELIWESLSATPDAVPLGNANARQSTKSLPIIDATQTTS